MFYFRFGRWEPNGYGFGPEGTGSIANTAKDQPSTCAVGARKIGGSESPGVGR